MKLSLIVPIYNESGHLSEFLSKLDALQLPVAKELVFVNDCSVDDSGRILDEFRFKSDVQIIHQPKNRGKGAAVALGISKATGDIIGIQDADFEYDLGDIPKLVAPLVDGKADVVYGSRFKKTVMQVHRTFHYLVNRFLTLLSNFLSGLYLTDMETCYKFFRCDLIQNINLESKRFGFEPEVTAKIAQLKVRVVELPVWYHPRSYIDGKKITWKDGIAAVRHIFYFNLLANRSSFYKPELPKHYIPSGRQWL